LEYIRIRKEILYGLLRDKFPNETNFLNVSYAEYKKNKSKGYPGLMESSEHQIPYWHITIKDGKLISKKIEID